MDLTKSTGTWAEEARKAYSAKQYELAASLFGQAAEGFKAVGDAPHAAEMRNNQSVALLQAGKASQALEAVAGTAEIFARIGDLRRQAMALGNQAAALEELGRKKEALRDFQQAADLLKGAGENEMRALLLKRISALQLRSRKPVEALLSMDAAVESSQRRSWSERLISRLMALVKKNAGLG